MAKSKAPLPLRVGQRVELTIDSLVAGGEGLARHQGYAVFVPFVAKGDRVEAEVISAKPSHARALSKRVLQGGPGRATPPCPVYKRCGGCSWQHLGYAAQLEAKRGLVVDALKRLGGVEDAEGLVDRTLPSPLPWGYRTKAHWALAYERGRWQVGLYALRTHEVVQAPGCGLQAPALDDALAALKAYLPISGLVPFDEQSGRGWLRSAFAKVGHDTGQVMVGLVGASDRMVRPEAFVAAMRQAVPGLVTVVLNVHAEAGNKLMGHNTVALWGPGHILERCGELTLELSDQAFAQVNGGAREALYAKAAQAVRAHEGTRILDAFAGTGAIALGLAEAGAREVVGVELVAAAVADAESNARRNHLEDRTRFVAARCEEYLPQLAAQGERFDAVVLDPPRKGAEAAALEAIAALGPKRIAYVSCDPATLARDVGRLRALGYRLVQATPVDMFPQTAHVEAVAELVREDAFEGIIPPGPPPELPSELKDILAAPAKPEASPEAEAPRVPAADEAAAGAPEATAAEGPSAVAPEAPAAEVPPADEPPAEGAGGEGQPEG